MLNLYILFYVSVIVIRMPREFTVIMEEGEDGYLISEVVELPGCHTQARNLEELMKRTKEAISLYLKSKKDLKISRKEFDKYL